jgi:hypothetical protein
MSTTPPPQQPSPGYDRPYYGSGIPPLPILNGELLVFLLAWAVVGIITLASDSVNPDSFVTATVALAFGYMISRGIAKAGKVLEGR